jgi:hypothetical protein
MDRLEQMGGTVRDPNRILPEFKTRASDIRLKTCMQEIISETSISKCDIFSTLTN